MEKISAVARAFPLYSTTSRKRPGAGAASVPAPPPSRNVRVYLRVPHDAWGTVQADLTAVAEGIQLAARLVDTPPNVLSTTAFVEEAMAVARGLPPSTVQVKVIRGEELKDQGFGGLYGVGKAAVEPPALVVLSYVAAGSAEGGGGGANIPGAAGSVCFVGKGIIYDTGGLSIKTKTGMVSWRFPLFCVLFVVELSSVCASTAVAGFALTVSRASRTTLVLDSQKRGFGGFPITITTLRLRGKWKTEK